MHICVISAIDASFEADIREAGGLPPLVALLRSANPETVRYACAVLGNCAANEENRPIIFQLGALPLLLHHVQSDDITVQANALRALAMSSYDGVSVLGGDG